MLKLYIWFISLSYVKRLALVWALSTSTFLAIGFAIFLKG